MLTPINTLYLLETVKIINAVVYNGKKMKIKFILKKKRGNNFFINTKHLQQFT